MNYLIIFDNQVRLYNKNIAITDNNGSRHTTYNELDILSNKVSDKIHKLGIDKNSYIAINMDRKMEYIAAYIGILKAGCVAITLVPEYPKDRVEFILNNSDSKLMITDDFFSDIDQYDKFIDLADDSSPALLVYTSGSTGNPKGIVYTVADYSRIIGRIGKLFENLENIRYAATALMSFAAHMMEYFPVFSSGGTVHIISDEVRKSVELTEKYYKDNKITVGYIPPQMLRIFKGESDSIERIISGGERIINAYSEKFQIYCMYGMSEINIVSYFPVDKKYSNTPIGYPLGETEILILDDDGNIVENGKEGEICIKGKLDTYYFKDEAGTEKARTKDGEYSLWHTGDIGYKNENGAVVYVNRKDWMVKINGQRVETLEIENLLTTIENINNACVKAFVDDNDQTYLVAYYSVNNKVSDEEIKGFLKSKLPLYMIPRYFVKMEELPKNPNGKLNRKVLTPPDISAYKSEYVKPETEEEKLLAKAFEEVLNCGKVGVNDDFFSLGGDSIKILHLLKHADIPSLTQNDILKGKTIRNIINLIDKNKSDIRHYEEIDEITPLTLSQKGVYFECMNDPDSLMYNIPMLLNLNNNIDINRLIKAVKTVAKNHKAFSVTINTPDGIPSMIYKDKDISVDIINTDDVRKEAEKQICPFDLENGPLYRFIIIKDEKHSAFFYDIHHLIFDGSSNSAFIKELSDVYNGNTIKKEELTIFDISKDEERMLKSKEYMKASSFFKEKFESCECDSNIIPDVLVETDDTKASKLSIKTDNKFTKNEIIRFSKKNKISESILFVAAFSYALMKFNGMNECLFTTASSGRHDKRLNNTIGMFVKTVPLYFKAEKDIKISEYLKLVQDDFYKTLENDCISFSELSGEYSITNDIAFIYQSELLNGETFSDDRLNLEALETNYSQTKLDFMMLKKDSSFELIIHYKNNLYTEELVKSFSDMYLNIVSEMMKVNTLFEINLLDANDIKELVKYNNTEVEYDSTTNVVDLFRKQAKKTPDNYCVVFNDKKYTYKETDEITDRLATYLISKGIKKESVVGVLIPRCEFMVIASLGILKAGAAYLPLDPTYPKDRLNLMMKDSEASILIYNKKYSDVIDDSFTGFRMDADEILSLNNEITTLPQISPSDMFVMLYTSGSTGVPKGVIFEHSNTLVTTEFVKRYFSINEKSHCTSYASYGFDAHAFDIYPAITSGAELHVIDEEIRLDFPRLRDYFNNNKITHTVMTTQVGRQFAQLKGLNTLKHISVAGEKLTPLSPPENINFYNLYGPTEGSIITSAFLVDKKYTDIPIGKAVDNLKTYIVDKENKLLPFGAVGELVISGPHVTRGYKNRKEATEKAYTLNPYSDQKTYNRLYHTGDIVRMLSDGNIQFVGRRDGQVKIRGFRIELTEIEEVIRQFPDIKDATVAAFDDKSGGKFVAAYIVSEKEIDIDKLKDFIAEKKPPYMVPAVIMQIESIPLNQNQKVNKKALPIPERKAEKIDPVENETQQKILDIIASVINHNEFGINTDIYDAGLTSIGAVKLNVELSESFDTPVRIADIKKNSTVKKLETFLSKNSPKENYSVQNDYPLTETQNGIFVECMSNSNTTIYNIPVLIKLSDNTDLDKLYSSIEKAIDCHSYVKTTLFTDKDGNVRQKRNDGASVNIERIKLEKLSDKYTLLKPFTLLDSPLYRISIIETEEENFLFMDFHHIISDGTSEAILFNDISDIYLGKEVEKEKYSGFEAAIDEEKDRQSERYISAKEYYSNLLSKFDETIPPKSEKEKSDKKSSTVRYISDAEKIISFCSDNKISLNAYFNAAFSIVLSKYINSDEVTYATIYNGRSDSRLYRSITMLTKTLPVASVIDYEKEPKEYISSIEKQLIDNMSNDIYSFAEISAKYRIKSNLIFAYQGDAIKLDKLCGEDIELIEFEADAAKADISINVYLKNNKFEYVCEYNTDVYSKDFSYSMADAVNQTALSFITASKLKDISMISDYANNKYITMNNSDVQTENILVHEIIERIAKEIPDKTAVIANKESLTYKELNEKANILANRLIDFGVKKDDIIGLVLDRTKEVMIAEIAVMKAGGAFLPMVPSYPDERIDFCLNNADSPYVITSKDLFNEKQDLFSENKNYKTLIIEDLIDSGNTGNPSLDISDDSLCYCIYTSGSTGTPKGVMIEHKNFSNFVQTDYIPLEYYKEKYDGCAMATSSISFDMSLYELYLPLTHKKTLCIATEEEFHNPLQLKDLMVENKIQMMVCTPSFMNNIVSINEFSSALSNLVSIVVGAEAFPASLYKSLKNAAPKLQIINGYGPTETSICCSTKELRNGEKITIGRPTGNAKFFVVDKYQNILPPYAIGELIICGKGVGRGYVKLPEKTESVFFKLKDYKAYHSGDSVRLTGDSEIEFGGRIDNQVKLRGFRIELDEIKKVMAEFSDVRQSEVIVRNNGTEDYLAAFFTSEKQIDIEELTQFMKSRLTYYMVPSVIMQIDKMPLTPNGKIDKKAFPETKKQTKKKDRRRAPKKSLEQRLCEIFSSVLSIDDIYADDNFFELGGTSLSASKVTMMLMSEGIEIKYGDIFDNPTPEDLSEFIERRDKKKSDVIEVKVSDKKTRDALKFNKVKFTPEVKRESLGNILLTGATGFLGVHVLKELLEIENGHIYCLVRRGKHDTPEIRLKTMLIYYFSKGFEEELKNRITILEADISDDNIFETLKDVPFDTVINCAACVKHFADDDILERINVHGVENLIKICQYKNCRMTQISTVTIAGMHTDESYEKQIVMHEDELFMIDDMDNKYVISKYHAEEKMLDAIEEGMRGKIIRVGNLMGRHSDGEFQANMETNMFMSGIRGFSVMGKYPISHMTDPMSFSPIDCTARAVVLLAGVNDKFTAFNCDNRYGFDEMKIIDACNRNGIIIKAEDDEIYYKEFQEKLGDDRINSKLNGLAAYDIKDAHIVKTDNLFTTNVLYRIGFSWPLVDDTYLDKAINSIMTLDYFDIDDELK